MRIFKTPLCMSLSLCALLLSACGGNGGEISVSDTPSVSSVSPSETTVTTVTETVSEAASDTVTGTEKITKEQSETLSEIAETKSETRETSEISPQTDDVPTVSEASETAALSETETSPANAVANAGANTETTAQKAEIVIPEVKIPLANGSSVITAENGEVDYGNASDGYISAVYTGKSDAVKLRIKCGDTQYDHDLDPGGKREFFPLMGSGSYTVKMYEHVSGKNYAEILSGDFEAAVKSETTSYLYPNKYVTYGNGSECVKKAAEVCAGKNSDVEKIGAIFDWTTDNIAYDKTLAATVQSGYIPDPDRTIAAKKGICFDYASLFAAMCRSQSIPSRLVIGYAEPDIYHAWNEVYTEETGWITPELFLKKKGYNIADATFYAGNSDKEKIAGYISDEGNYSAMYRY